MFTKRRESHLLQTIGATVLGMSAGILLGMLIAPKQGKEIRACITDKTKDFVDVAKDLGKNLKEAIQSDDEEIFYYDDDDKLVFSKNFIDNEEE
jgi:hypothetical protein